MDVWVTEDTGAEKMQIMTPEKINLSPEVKDLQWFTPVQFAKIVGVSAASVHRWHRLGYLKFTQFSPGRYYIARSELDRYMSGKTMEKD